MWLVLFLFFHFLNILFIESKHQTSSSKVSFYPLILSFGMIDTLACRTDSVAPIYILFASFFFIIVFIFYWCCFLSSIIYSKLGVNFPFRAIIAFFNSGINYCYSSFLVASLRTIWGIHCYKILPKCIAELLLKYMNRRLINTAENRLPGMEIYRAHMCYRNLRIHLSYYSRRRVSKVGYIA